MLATLVSGCAQESGLSHVPSDINIEEGDIVIVIGDNEENDDEDISEEVSPDNSCGFTQRAPYTDNDLETWSDVQYRNVGPTDINIEPGEAIDLTFEVQNSNCGWIVIEGLEPSVTSWNNSTFIQEVDSLDMPMTLTIPTLAETYEVSGYSVLEYGEQLFYPFGVGFYATDIERIWVAPGASATVNFRFTATHSAPVGAEIDMALAWLIWTDVTSGTTVNDMDAWLLPYTVATISN